MYIGGIGDNSVRGALNSYHGYMGTEFVSLTPLSFQARTLILFHTVFG